MSVSAIVGLCRIRALTLCVPVWTCCVSEDWMLTKVMSLIVFLGMYGSMGKVVVSGGLVGMVCV